MGSAKKGEFMKQIQVLISADNPLNIKTLNNVAVEYFEMGLWDLSYQIWAELYHTIQRQPNNQGLMPIISCNMGNVLRQTGYYTEAFHICRQGLKWCFGTGRIYAIPELTLQLSILCMKTGYIQDAESLYSFGKSIFHWSRRSHIQKTLDEILEQDFLLYSSENSR